MEFAAILFGLFLAIFALAIIIGTGSWAFVKWMGFTGRNGDGEQSFQRSMRQRRRRPHQIN